MPKIPRINQGDSSINPTTAAPLSAESVAMPGLALAGLADTAFQVLSAEDKRVALEQRAALEQKQAIANEVEAGRRADDYEESLVSYMANLRKEFADSPDKAPAQLLELGRGLQDSQRQAVSNTQVGLEFAQRSNTRLSQAVREMHDWALGQQTIKIKGDLKVRMNRAINGAESVGSLEGLKNYIAARKADLASAVRNVYGSGESDKMDDLGAAMTRAWVRAQDSSEGALMALEALDSTKVGDPTFDNLDGDERNALRKDAMSSFAGSFKRRLLDELKRGTSQNHDLFDVVMNDPQNAGGAIIAAQNALEEQYVAVKAQKKIDLKAIQKWGVDLHGHSPDEIPEAISDRLRYVKALDYARRNMIGLDAEDDPASLAGAVLRTNKVIHSSDGKTMTNYVKQQADIAELYSNKRITVASFTALFTNLATALVPALEDAENPAGPNKVRAWFSPKIAGDVRLNAEFATLPKLNADQGLQDRIRIRYYTQLNAAAARGLVLKNDDAREMAMRALEYETARAALEKLEGKK